MPGCTAAPPLATTAAERSPGLQGGTDQQHMDLHKSAPNWIATPRNPPACKIDSR